MLESLRAVKDLEEAVPENSKYSTGCKSALHGAGRAGCHGWDEAILGMKGFQPLFWHSPWPFLP